MLIPLKCTTQQYAWGKIGMDSTVAVLGEANGCLIDKTKPYAELWMGTHPNGPAYVTNEFDLQILLSDYLAQNPFIISSNVAAQEAVVKNGLPYLFKILSVNTALSIQSHPDKCLAERLHAEQPQIYKDSNHKPEMACAISRFEVLAGFRPVSEVVYFITNTPELKCLFRIDDTLRDTTCESEEKEKLKTLFSSLMTLDSTVVSSAVYSLQQSLEKKLKADELDGPDKIALRLSYQYPGDVGVFCPYFLCYRMLEPGQAVFLNANEPHAYLCGDCAEIMACSDNVIRAGLTPKLRDTKTLISSLSYNQVGHCGSNFHPSKLLESTKAREADSRTRLYVPHDPAVTEFQMERSEISPQGDVLSLQPANFVGILLVLGGEGTVESGSKKKIQKDITSVHKGHVFVLPADESITLSNSSSTKSLIVFRVSIRAAF